MVHKSLVFLLAGTLLLTAACEDNTRTSNAYGNFEADEILISAETPGKILRLNVQEGEILQAGDTVAQIDTSDLHLQRLTLDAQRGAVRARYPQLTAQIDIIKAERAVLERDKSRLEALVADSAATQQELDGVNGRLDVLEERIRSIRTQHEPLLAELGLIDAQEARLNDMFNKSTIVNPVGGTVLIKHAEEHELASPGRPLYTIAALDELDLRVFVSGADLPNVKLGEQAEVIVDDGKGSLRSLPGVVSWVNAKAEFTPTTVQTREERVNLVYAVKVRTPNDGTLKIGMPGEVNFGTGQ